MGHEQRLVRFVVSTKLERLIGGMQVPVPFSELPHLSANLVASE